MFLSLKAFKTLWILFNLLLGCWKRLTGVQDWSCVNSEDAGTRRRDNDSTLIDSWLRLQFQFTLTLSSWIMELCYKITTTECISNWEEIFLYIFSLPYQLLYKTKQSCRTLIKYYIFKLGWTTSKQFHGSLIVNFEQQIWFYQLGW